MKQLHSLTSLRFFAALWVVLFHLVETLKQSDMPVVSTAMLNLFGEGYIAVTFFFILSGFILAHSYGQRLRTGRVSRKAFFASRIARIYPLHLLTLLLALPLFVVGVVKYDQPVISLPFNLLLLQAFVPDVEVYFSLNLVSWSISDEQLFYVLFPMLVLLSGKRLLLIAAAIFITALGLFLVLTEAALAEYGHFAFYIFPVSRLGDFVVGILAYRFYVRHEQVGSATASLLQCCSLFLFVVFYLFSGTVSDYLRYDYYYVPPMVFMVYSFAYQNGIFARAISSQRLVLLGEASFGLYLIHQLVIRYGDQAVENLGITPLAEEHVLRAVFYLTTSVLLSVFVYKKFEIPAKRITRSILMKLDHRDR